MSAGISTPGVAGSDAAWRRQIERRIELLETQSRLYNSAIREGTLRIQNADGEPMVTLGKLDDGTYGIQVQNNNQRTVLKVASDGTQLPMQGLPVTFGSLGQVSGLPNGFRPGTELATYDEMWRADFWTVGDTVTYDLTLFPNGGDMDWKIAVGEVPAAGSPAPVDVVGPNNETSNVVRRGSFVIPAAALLDGSDPVGRRMTMRIYAKKNSGAGTVDIALNGPPFNLNS